MNDWTAFFECVDGLEPSGREDYTALLHRNFVACGYPTSWEGFTNEPHATQKRLVAEWHAWALRDVEWIPLGG